MLPNRNNNRTVLGLIAAISTGCSEPGLPAAMVDVDWHLDSIVTDTGTVIVPSPWPFSTEHRPAPHVQFRPDPQKPVTGQVFGFFGCNWFAGPYLITLPSRMIFGDLVATLSACSDQRGSIEGAFAGAMIDVARYEVHGDRLVLRSGRSDELHFRR